jgi:PTH1 family peptidyl-tRNA hydrolase
MYLIVGLGNPGTKYAETRHNVGFLFLDYLYTACRGTKSNEYEKYNLAELKMQRNEFWLVKPTTFMNLSGEAVKKVIAKAKGKDKDFSVADKFIVVHDDIDLEPGQIKIKENGGDGGHNGVKDIITALNTDQFIRIRVGVGKPKEKYYDAAKHVLDKFTKDEWKLLWEDIFPKLHNFINEYLVFGLSKARSRLSQSLLNKDAVKTPNKE